jgi:hypothetical protein
VTAFTVLGVAEGGAWREYPLLTAIEYLPVFYLLIRELHQGGRGQRGDLLTVMENVP